MLKSSIVVMWASRGKKENNWISLSSLLINLDFLKIAQVLTSRKWKLAPTFKMYHFVFFQGITAQNWGYKICPFTYYILLSLCCCTHIHESDSTKNILNFQTKFFYWIRIKVMVTKELCITLAKTKLLCLKNAGA